jgi:hypothetical protein
LEEELQSLIDSVFTDEEIARLVEKIAAESEKDLEALSASLPTDEELRQFVEEYAKPDI